MVEVTNFLISVERRAYMYILHHSNAVTEK